MAHHAYFIVAAQDEAISASQKYTGDVLGLVGSSNPDIRFFKYGLFSVADARSVGDAAYQSSISGKKVIIIYAQRLFHEAQNALLKVFEEPPEGVTIILGVPTLGILLPTLKSRLQQLPQVSSEEGASANSLADSFISLNKAEREKYITKLVDRSKSDKEDIKQAARGESAALIDELIHISHNVLTKEKSIAKKEEFMAFIKDLTAFAPLMHERSVPLKLIFEHVSLTLPTDLVK